MRSPAELLRNRSSKLLSYLSPWGEITIGYNAKAITSISLGSLGVAPAAEQKCLTLSRWRMHHGASLQGGNSQIVNKLYRHIDSVGMHYGASAGGQIFSEYNDEAILALPSHVAQCVAELEEYFAGQRREFTFPIEFEGGTEFQRLVWHALLTIPYGCTVAYGALLPGKARAVAQACHVNPLAIVVPCHRVIAANGTVHGYAYGPELKRRLLTLEGVGC